jgi:hypothetical protein
MNNLNNLMNNRREATKDEMTRFLTLTSASSSTFAQLEASSFCDERLDDSPPSPHGGEGWGEEAEDPFLRAFVPWCLIQPLLQQQHLPIRSLASRREANHVGKSEVRREKGEIHPSQFTLLTSPDAGRELAAQVDITVAPSAGELGDDYRAWSAATAPVPPVRSISCRVSAVR